MDSLFHIYILPQTDASVSTLNEIRHEIVGIVKEVGSNVDGFKVGNHVGVGTYVNSCRECEYCNISQEVHCATGVVGTFNSVDVDGTVTKGGYSSYYVVDQR